MNNQTTVDWTLLAFRCPNPMVEKLDAAASDVGASRSDILRKALAQYLTRGQFNDHRHRELVLSGSNSRYPVERILEWLLAKRPQVGDLATSEAKLDPRLKRCIQQLLSNKIANRVVLKFEGHNLETIGRMEGCSKQAVHASIKRGLDTLGNNRDFVAVLCSITESNFTADELMAIAREIK